MLLGLLDASRKFWRQKKTKLDRAFVLDIEHQSFNKRCPVKHIIYRFVYSYNADVNDFIATERNVSIQVFGSFSSWKYTKPIEAQLRRKLQFWPQLVSFANNFLYSNIPPGWNASRFVRVGLHVRRGDFLGPWARSRGYTVATKRYISRSIAYFLQRY